jgi:formyltetrahydrofolate synthetase
MPRSFKLLVVALVLSNIGVGSFAFYSLRALDRKYSALVAGAVPTLNDLQTLTALEVGAMRQTNPSLIVSAANAPESIERAREALRRELDLRNSLLQRRVLTAHLEQRQEFERAGEEFTHAANELVNATASAVDVSDLTRRREEIVRPAFERYLIATTKFADAVEADSLKTSGALSMETSSLARMILAAGNWPVAIVLLLLLVSVAMLVFAIRSSLFVEEEHWRT